MLRGRCGARAGRASHRSTALGGVTCLSALLQARDHARALMGTPEFAKSRDERKKVERRFAHLKTHHRFKRMRFRGLSGARDEFHLAAIVQNLKTLASKLWQQPPDALVVGPM